MILRPYQEQAVESVLGSIIMGDTDIVLEAPTGSGKSVIISELCKRLEGNIIVMVNITALIDQIADHLREVGIDFSILKAGMEEHYDENHRVQLVMSHTFYARVDKIKMKCNYLIIDERHREYDTERTRTLRRAVKPEAVIGLTATPYDKDGYALHDAELIQTVSVDKLTKDGYLSPVRYMIPKWSTQLNLDGVRMSGSDYSGTALDEKLNNEIYMNKVIASMNAIDGKSHKSLVFCNSIAQCDLVTKYLINDGYKAKAIHSEKHNKENDEILESFRSNTGVNCLVSVSKLNIGFDVRDITLGVMLRPTKVRSLYIQTVGRLTRTAEGKSDAIFLDLSGVVMEHGFHDEVYCPPKTGHISELEKEKSHAAAVEIPYIVSEEPTEVSRHKIDVFIEELRNKAKTKRDMTYLSTMFDLSNDVYDIIDYAFQIQEFKTGKSYKKSTVTWIDGNWKVNLTLYPEKRRHWISALKTRAKNIVREGKNLASLYYFIDFLVENMDNEDSFYR